MLRYAITDRLSLSRDQIRPFQPLVAEPPLDLLVAQAQRLALTGVDLLQLREKDLSASDLELLASRIVQTLHLSGHSTPRILLNGPAHIAVAARAHGVHLPGGGSPGTDLPGIRQAFQLAGLAPPLVSTSCHSLEEVQSAASAGFDFILFGPIFEKRVHGHLVAPGLGLEQLQQAARLTHAAGPTSPHLLALGGITPQNTPLCLAAGADGIAGIRLFL